MRHHRGGPRAFRFLVLHGPNLNLLGQREQAVYGTTTLTSINSAITRAARGEGVRVTIKQSNREAELVEWIQGAKGRYDAVIINPAAYTHTSVAIRDAITAVEVPTIEVHLSNIYRREAFRLRSYTAGVVVGQISGFGPNGYLLALKAAVANLRKTDASHAR